MKSSKKQSGFTKPIRFWSSVEYTSIMLPIVSELQKLGYIAEHRYLINSVDYRTADTALRRLWLRVRMYLLYPLYFVSKEISSPSSHCVICTNTFYTPLLSTYIKRAGRKSIHLLYDLFPDALVASGKLGDNSLIARSLNNIVNKTLQRSDANVILGTRLQQHIESRLPSNAPADVIPVGTECNSFPNTMPIKERPHILYCGNFGHLHDVDTIIGALKNNQFSKLGIPFRFCGNGAGMETLKSSIEKNSQVTFSSGLKADEWAETMSQTPIGLVTMKPGAETILLPSKTYSAMAAGQAILAICPSKSDLADLVRKHNCGWVIEPGDVDKLIEALRTITQNNDAVEQKRRNSQQAAREHYDSPIVAKQWTALFQRLDNPQCQKR